MLEIFIKSDNVNLINVNFVTKNYYFNKIITKISYTCSIINIDIFWYEKEF